MRGTMLQCNSEPSTGRKRSAPLAQAAGAMSPSPSAARGRAGRGGAGAGSLRFGLGAGPSCRRGRSPAAARRTRCFRSSLRRLAAVAGVAVAGLPSRRRRVQRGRSAIGAGRSLALRAIVALGALDRARDRSRCGRCGRSLVAVAPRSSSWRLSVRALIVAGVRDHVVVAVVVVVDVFAALAALLLEARAAFAEHAEIMVGDIADNIRSARGRPRAARRAPCSYISRAAARHCRAGDCPGGCRPAGRPDSGAAVPRGRDGGHPVDY